MIDDEHPESARAEVLADRLREYVPDIPKDMEPVVMVRYSENDEIKKGKFYGIGELVEKLKEQNEVKLTDMQDMYFLIFKVSVAWKKKEPIKIAEQVTVNDRGAVKQVVRNVDDKVERENTEKK